MSSRVGFFFLILLLFTISLWAADQMTANLSPAKPKIGDEITITYNADSKGASLRNPKEVTAQLLLMRQNNQPLLQEIPMRKSGKVWKASWTLKDENARLLLLRFVSGEKTDDNGGNVWLALVHDVNGVPIKGAHTSLASIYRSGGFMDFKTEKDAEKAKAELAAEEKLHPGQWQIGAMRWSMMLREAPTDDTKAKIKQELSEMYEANRDDSEALNAFVYWFEQTGQKEKADELRTAELAADPKGKFAESVRRTEMFRERDPAKRVELYEQFVKDFPRAAEEAKNFGASFYLGAKQYDKAMQIAESMKKPDGNLFNNIAWPQIEAGENLEQAVSIAKKGIDLLRKPDASAKPPYFSQDQWKKSNETALGYIFDTYAFGLFKLGRTQEAEKAYEEAQALTKGNQADINERLVECYVRNGKYQKAIDVSTELLRKGKTNDKLIAHFKEAYAKIKGSEAGFDEAVKRSRDFAKNEIKDKLLKERINKPSIDFELKSLDGKTVKLSALKGKVVVLDFWATWCGPCKASFPFLQQVYEKYKSNENVVILALNTWESTTGKEREETVKKFIEENKYTFPVLYDVNYVEKYGVEGIPTKFIIDRNGRIQFKDIGFSGGQEMVDKMSLEIDLLLSDEFYSVK